MPTPTENLKLNIFNEDEVFDVDQINENFQKLDAVPVCIETGVTTASYSGALAGSANWRYRKFNDGTAEMSTAISFTTLRANQGDAVPYYSNAINLNFPFQMASVYDVQMHMASNTKGWIIDTSNNLITSGVTFVLASSVKESDADYYKQVFIHIKGVLTN